MNYLSVRILDKVIEMRKEISKHQSIVADSIKENAIFAIYSFIVITWKLFTTTITTTKDLAIILSIHIKQFLNEIDKYDKLFKLLAHNNNDYLR